MLILPKQKGKNAIKAFFLLSVVWLLLVCICFMGFSYVLFRNKDQKEAVSPSVSSNCRCRSLCFSFAVHEIPSSPCPEEQRARVPLPSGSSQETGYAVAVIWRPIHFLTMQFLLGILLPINCLNILPGCATMILGSLGKRVLAALVLTAYLTRFSQLPQPTIKEIRFPIIC